jgi:hypothetical protein
MQTTCPPGMIIEQQEVLLLFGSAANALDVGA